MTNVSVSSSNLQEFFLTLVRDASQNQKVNLPEGVEFYLVNLLQTCTTTQNAYPTPTEGFREEPLALMLCKALQADSHHRIAILRRLGDFSLYMTGFFPESLKRQLVDITYYIEMGETAYGNLSRLLSDHSAFSEIYDDLARRFMAHVDILAEVSEKGRIQNGKNTDLLRLYETWLHTGSERSRRLLSQAGILPIQDTSLKAQ